MMGNLRIERTGPLVVLKLDRPDQLNALNRLLLLELQEAINQARKDEIKALIITGNGDKAFAAGADIKEMQPMTPWEMVRFSELGQRVISSLEEAPFLTLAAVNGYCLGGGLELALGCDFIFASQKAKLGAPETTLGLIPAFGGTQRLARAVGTRRAKELVMSGRSLSADEAKEWGLVNRVCAPDELLGVCEEMAKAICKNPACAVIQAKRAIDVGVHCGIAEGLELERNMCGVAFSTPDRLEGMTAFVEKRVPQYQS